MKRNGIGLAMVMAGMAAAGAAQAGGLMGAGIGYADDLRHDNASGFKSQGALGGTFYAGYRFDQLPLMAELSYLDMGSHRLTDSQDGHHVGDFGFKGVNASVGVPLRIGPMVTTWFKAGYYNGTSDLRIDGLSPLLPPGIEARFTHRSTGASAGLGADFMLTAMLGLRFDYQVLFEARDFTGDDGNGKSMLSMASVGMTLAFGGAAPAAPAVIYTPVATPPPAPAAAPMPEPVAAPVPVAAPAPIAVPGSTLHAGAVIRTRPMLDAPVATTLRAETPAQLTTRIVNAAGAWWFIKSGNLQGWVQDAQVSK